MGLSGFFTTSSASGFFFNADDPIDDAYSIYSTNDRLRRRGRNSTAGVARFEADPNYVGIWKQELNVEVGCFEYLLPFRDLQNLQVSSLFRLSISFALRRIRPSVDPFSVRLFILYALCSISICESANPHLRSHLRTELLRLEESKTRREREEKTNTTSLW